MSGRENVDRLRGPALDRFDRAERNYRLGLISAAAIEALFLLAYLSLADFSNRLQVLLFITTVATYTVLVLGLLALGAHVSRSTLRILKAIEGTSSIPPASK